MPRSSKTLPFSRAKTTRSKPPSVSVTQRNANAHERTQSKYVCPAWADHEPLLRCVASVMSRLECIGSTIIDELKGLQRDHLKQQLISTSRSNTTTHSHFSFSPTRRSLRDVLDVMHSFEDYTQRQCRSIAVGENLDVSTKSKKNTTISNDGSHRLTTLQRTEKLAASPTPVSAGASSSTIRTICTRSSTLKISNHNQALGHQGEQMNSFDQCHLSFSDSVSNT